MVAEVTRQPAHPGKENSMWFRGPLAYLDALRSTLDADTPEAFAAALAQPEHASIVALLYQRPLPCSELQDSLVGLQPTLETLRERKHGGA
jgi:hypothetical protein